MKSTSRKFLVGCGAAFLLFSASAQAVIYQAENYNAFNDTTAGNSGGAFRADNVDIEATADSGGGFNVGWIAAGEWLAFNGLSRRRLMNASRPERSSSGTEQEQRIRSRSAAIVRQ